MEKIGFIQLHKIGWDFLVKNFDAISKAYLIPLTTMFIGLISIMNILTGFSNAFFAIVFGFPLMIYGTYKTIYACFATIYVAADYFKGNAVDFNKANKIVEEKKNDFLKMFSVWVLFQILLFVLALILIFFLMPKDVMVAAYLTVFSSVDFSAIALSFIKAIPVILTVSLVAFYLFSRTFFAMQIFALSPDISAIKIIPYSFSVTKNKKWLCFLCAFSFNILISIPGFVESIPGLSDIPFLISTLLNVFVSLLVLPIYMAIGVKILEV